MATTEQKKKLLKAKIAVALQDELGRVPKKEEIDNVFFVQGHVQSRIRTPFPAANPEEKWLSSDYDEGLLPRKRPL